MIKFIKNTLRLYIEQITAETKLRSLLPKKTKYKKIYIPEQYIEMMFTLAEYGINDNKELIKKLEK